MYEPFLMQAFGGWFNGLIKAISQVWQLVVPNDVTEGQCIALTSLVVTGMFIYRTALQGFLLWRLKGVDNKKRDLWIGVVLFTARVAFNFAQFFQIRPEVVYDDEESAYFCRQGLDLARTQVLGYISIDLLIECYVTFRFMQILTKANKTALLVAGESKTKKKKRTIFTAIIYWNFLRLFLAISQSAMFVGWTISGIYRNNDQESALYINNTQALLLIGLSYAITIDAEIVRVIEGRRPSVGSKSLKNITRYSRNAYVPNKNIQSFQSSSSESSNNATIVESFDNNNDVKITPKEENQNPSVNKGSSFDEWGKIVTDRRLTKEYDGLVVNEGEIKEHPVNITSNNVIINQEDQGIVNEGEIKKPSVNITSNDAIINQEDQEGIVNEGETKEPSVNITSNNAIINQGDSDDVKDSA
nr:1231_t:CDS:2 [Entrophospora candida]